MTRIVPVLLLLLGTPWLLSFAPVLRGGEAEDDRVAGNHRNRHFPRGKQ